MCMISELTTTNRGPGSTSTHLTTSVVTARWPQKDPRSQAGSGCGLHQPVGGPLRAEARSLRATGPGDTRRDAGFGYNVRSSMGKRERKRLQERDKTPLLTLQNQAVTQNLDRLTYLDELR